ncbi:MAG: hypothetical protein RIE08_09600 [Acidimicrobiales bacterium]
MNDDTRLDEIASAVLDGEASEAERALADSDPRVAARVETLRRVRAVIADVAPPDPDQREQAVAAALAVAGDTGENTTVTSLDDQRRRRHMSTRTLRIAGIAAALAAGFLVVSLIAVLASSGDGDEGDGDFATGEPAGSAAADAALEEAEISGLAGSDTTADAPGRTEPDEAMAAPEAVAGDDAATGDGGAGEGSGDDPQSDATESAAVGPMLAVLPDLGEVAATDLVDLAAPGGFDPDGAVGVTDEALACAEVLTSLEGADGARSFVATVDDRRVAVTPTPDGVLVIDLADCSVTPAR